MSKTMNKVINEMNSIMTVKDLKHILNNISDNTELLVGNDEELNILYKNWEIGKIDNDRLVIYGLSGSEEF
ncbi:MAG: hypothetical protein DRI86_07440 [Bacteroidetes bacterium]|nr:MAG: hypothetical protein DRI86_07440 [Bacteroidota bacterium]